MRRLIIILLTLFVSLSFDANAQTERKSYFAVGLFTSGHSQMVTFAFVDMVGENYLGVEIVRKERFIYTAMGYWPHPKLNPTRKNYFEEHDVDSCFLIKEGSKVKGYYAKPFEILWKIRFFEHPYDYDRPGWSQGQYTPSKAQQEFLLKEYGLRNILTEYIYGDTLFKLLRNVQDPSWIVQYRTAVKDTTKGP